MSNDSLERVRYEILANRDPQRGNSAIHTVADDNFLSLKLDGICGLLRITSY